MANWQLTLTLPWCEPNNSHCFDTQISPDNPADVTTTNTKGTRQTNVWTGNNFHWVPNTTASSSSKRQHWAGEEFLRLWLIQRRVVVFLITCEHQWPSVGPAFNELVTKWICIFAIVLSLIVAVDVESYRQTVPLSIHYSGMAMSCYFYFYFLFCFEHVTIVL